ncbi:MAG: hypothetical protein P8X95_27545 [Anaerolineales bacterium]|jgi:hypothetical protein
MNARLARGIAWSLVGVYIILATTGLSLQVSTGTYLRDFGFPALLIITLVAGLLYVLGAVIVWRQPRNVIGWLWCAMPTVWAIDLFSFGYAYYGLIAHPGSLPSAGVMLIWQSWTGGSFVIILATIMILRFPDGQLLSPRWGGVAWLAAAAISVYLPLDALEPGPSEVFPFLDNPFGASLSMWAVLAPLRSIVLFVEVMCLLTAAVSLALRLRRSRGDERQQIKWIVYAAAYFAVTLALVLYGEIGFDEIVLRAATVLHILSLGGLLAAMAMAMFKYRLYDIDLIINKTLVYGGLSGTLALVYFMSVVLLTQIFPAGSQIAIVLSTLAIAALFSPLRRRIQNDIDKRFYRRKYNAQRTLAAFGAKVRDEVELEQLSETLLEVVDETMQPAHISLWLKEDTVGGPGQWEGGTLRRGSGQGLEGWKAGNQT